MRVDNELSGDKRSKCGQPFHQAHDKDAGDIEQRNANSSQQDGIHWDIQKIDYEVI